MGGRSEVATRRVDVRVWGLKCMAGSACGICTGIVIDGYRVRRERG